MIIILKNIPANTKKKELEDFIHPFIKGGLFRKSGKIASIEIKEQKDPQMNAHEFHALVRIEPDAVANRIVKRLNRKLFKGKHIAIDEFHHRNWRNDRRINLHDVIDNKRKRDRRRPHLIVIEDSSDKFSSNKNFHRKLD